MQLMVARRAAALVLAGALVTGLAACGGGDDDEATDQVDLEDVESDASSSASSDEEEADDEDEGSDDSSGIDEEAIAGAFSEGCGEFITVFGALGGAIAGAFDPEAAEEFEGFIDDAPEEIQDDLETMAEAYGELGALFEEAGFDPEDPNGFDPSNPEAIEVFTEAAELFESPEFVAANEAISEFVASNCET